MPVQEKEWEDRVKGILKAELKRRGLSPRPDTDDSFHIVDPDGFDVQISSKHMDPKLI